MSNPSVAANGRPVLAVADRSDRVLRELMAVREIAHAFLTADHPVEVFQFALDRVSPLVGATLACVYLLDGASDLMPLIAAYNWPERYRAYLGEMKVRLGAGPSGEAASERRAIEVPDVFADPLFEDWQETATELGWRAIVSLPLQTAQRVLGAVTFYFADAGAFGDDTRGLLRIVADQMAATAEKAGLIDELRKANVALQETNAQLEQQYTAVVEARRVKDEFLANISHELRTPLTAVMGYISLLQEGLAGPLTQHQQESLVQVKDASERLLSLIEDLLELTTLKRGGFEVGLDSFDVREPLRDAVAATRPAGSGVTVLVHEPEGMLPRLRSDRKKVAKVLCVLLGNAFKFTPQGEVHVRVEVRQSRVVYTVEDTGIGIAPEAQQLIFEEFRQVDGSSTRRYGGSGLGLALARRLTQALGGEVALHSVPGEGSTFTVELPLDYDQHAAGELARAAD